MVHPGVVGRLLHHDVARLEVHLALVEQHVDVSTIVHSRCKFTARGRNMSRREDAYSQLASQLR